MIALDDCQSYLQEICNRYEQWRAENALTKAIADRQATFSFEQMVQTEEKDAEGKPKKISSLPIFKAIENYIKSEQILLIGSPGIGKSAILVQCLLHFAEAELNKPKPRIPVLVRLKQYTSGSLEEGRLGILILIKDALKQQLSKLRPRPKIEISDVEELLDDERLILLLDGLNEMPAVNHRTHLIAFREEYDQVPLICTTRELGGGDLGIKRRLEIQPLRSGEVERFLQDCIPDQTQKVLQLLNRDNRELSRTPFVLWMLYDLFQDQSTKVETLAEAFRQFFQSFKKYKEDAPVTDERRQQWNHWLEHLAFTMLNHPDPTDPGLIISKEQAEKILIEKFGGLYGASSRIEELLKYHLLEPISEKEISFHHQLIQEYYAAECLLTQLHDLLKKQSEQEYTSFQMNYLNHVKWTEAIALMLGLPELEDQTERLIELALVTDLMLGARLAGEVKPQFQVQSIALIRKQRIPKLVKVHLLGATRSTYVLSDLVHALLQHENITLSTDAAIMLWHLGSSALMDELLDLLDHDNYIVCANAAFAALGLRGINNDRIVLRLAEVLQDEREHEYFRESAARTLGALGNPKAIPALISALQDSSVHIREKAAEGLENLNDQTAFAPLLKITLEDQPLIIRWNAAHALGKIDAKAAMKEFLEVIENENYEMRERAAEAIEHLESEEMVPTLVELLKNHNKYRYSYIYSKAAKGLKKIGTEKALQGLIQALHHPDFEVCSAAINALGGLGNQTVIPKLTEMLEDLSPDVREEAAFALGRLGSKTAIRELINFFVEKQNRIVRGRTGTTAAQLLGNLDAKEAIPYLLKIVKEPKFQNSRSSGIVLAALGKLGCEEIIPELFKRLEEDKSWVQNEVIDGLASLNNQVVRSRLCELLEHSDRELRIAATKALSKLSDATTIEHLRKALEDSDLEVRLYVIDALEALCDFVSLPRLWQMQLVEGTNTSFLSVIKAIQTGDRCQFYNYEIYQYAQQVENLEPKDEQSNQEEYERILTTLHQMALVMERDPETFFTIGEEALRSHFLVQLNGIYKGQATGETFNCKGKTDIIVRLQGNNIFVGECKFWSGENKLKETLNQLLGYATLRDKQLGMLIFNRNKNFSAVLEQIPVILRSHSSFLREVNHTETEFRFILKHPDDLNCELNLAILVFNIPSISR